MPYLFYMISGYFALLLVMGAFNDKPTVKLHQRQPRNKTLLLTFYMHSYYVHLLDGECLSISSCDVHSKSLVPSSTPFILRQAEISAVAFDSFCTYCNCHRINFASCCDFVLKFDVWDIFFENEKKIFGWVLYFFQSSIMDIFHILFHSDDDKSEIFITNLHVSDRLIFTFLASSWYFSGLYVISSIFFTEKVASVHITIKIFPVCLKIYISFSKLKWEMEVVLRYIMRVNYKFD